jgi:hypothetical protein
MRIVSKKDVQQIKTNISYSITLFFDSHTVYETMWKNIIGQATNTIG